jgi:NADH:ubiquinone oxidoreductase subunit 5 (subunit L)/multisubunit Na+/H+ antiporter MnhA subunit
MDRYRIPGMDDFARVSDDVVVWLIMVSGVALLLFLFFYLWRPWRATAQGRALMTSAIGKVILLDALVVPFTLFGDYPLRWLVRLVGMAIFTAGSVRLLVTLMLSPGARKYPPWTWRRDRHAAD